jgi:hypothetical protein
VLESDLRHLFERQAATKLKRSPISIPVARRLGRARLIRRRAGAIGSPILAAGAVVAVLLAGPFAAAPSRPAPGNGLPAAPARFNPLVPYAAITWYPFRPLVVGSNDWRTTLMLRASSPSPARATQVVLYAAGWCTQKSASLTCGATTAGTRAELTVSGPAPDVQGQAAYWARFTGGNLSRLRALTAIRQALVFQYGRGGWAVVQSTGTQGDLLRVAASLRYSQTAPVRFPFQLTGLPSAWSDVLYAAFVQPAPGKQAPTHDELVLGSPTNRPGTPLREPLMIVAINQTTRGPRCQTKTVGGPNAGQTSPAGPCPSSVIGGYRVYLNSPPVKGAQTLFAPDADGLYLYEQADAAGSPLSPAAVLAHHLRLLGPDPANWTTTPALP